MRYCGLADRYEEYVVSRIPALLSLLLLPLPVFAVHHVGKRLGLECHNQRNLQE